MNKGSENMAVNVKDNPVTMEEVRELLNNLSKLDEEKQKEFLYMIKGAAFVTERINENKKE